MIKYNDSDFKQIVTRSDAFGLGNIADIYKPYNEPMRKGNLYCREMDAHNVSYIQISSDLFLFTAIYNNNVYELISNGSDGVIGNGKCNPVVVNLSEQDAIAQGLLPGNNEWWFTSESRKVKRTKAEYVKIDKNLDNGKFWEVARDWSEGERCVFHYFISESYFSVADNDRLLREYKANNLYRKVESEITWRDDVIDYLESFGGGECETFIEAIMENKNTGVKGFHYDGFINMCKLVAKSVDEGK